MDLTGRCRCLRMVDLPHFIDEEDVQNSIDVHADRITSIKLVKELDDHTRCSGYGYIHFSSVADAEKALIKYQSKRIGNLSARFVLSFSPDSEGTSVVSFQLYVGNLSAKTTDNELFQFFHTDSNHAINARVINDPMGISKCYGFVQYDVDEFAYKALVRFQTSPVAPKLHDSPLIIRETHQVTRAEIQRGVDHVSNTVIFIGNLNLVIGDTQLKESFSKFGFVESARVVPNKGFGFIQFLDHVSALAALSEMQGSELFHQRIHCSWGRMKHDSQPVESVSLVKRDETTSHEYYSAMTPSIVKKVRTDEKLITGIERTKLLELSLTAVGGSKSVPSLKYVKDINKEYIHKQILDLLHR